MDDEEIAERTRKERADIVRKYDIGREEGAVIDPWEDPDFEVRTLSLGGGILCIDCLHLIPGVLLYWLLQIFVVVDDRCWLLLIDVGCCWLS